MKDNKNDVGIISIGNYLPCNAIDTSTIVKFWKNSSLYFIENEIGCLKHRVLGSDEDIITMSVQSINNMINSYPNSIDNIGSIFLGSNTSSELFSSSAINIKNMINNSRNVFCQDILASELSGILGLVNGFGLIKSNLSKKSLIIGSDDLGKHTAPGNFNESYEGAGASSVVLGKENILLRIDEISVSSSEFPEVSRPEDERFIRNLMPLNRDVSFNGLIKRSIDSLSKLLKLEKKSINDFNQIILPQYSMKETYTLMKKIGAKKSQIENSLYFSQLGNIGNAGPILGIQMAIESSNPGDKILLISYGHSSQSISISFTVSNEIKSLLKNKGLSTKNEIMNSKNNLTYSDMLQMEDKIVQPNINFGPYY